MIFCPHVSLLSLLLLMCGPFFHQTLAVTSLEALENAYITAGHYSNEYHQSGETNWVARPNTTVIYRPVDIPALNQHLPLLYERSTNGTVLTAGLLMCADDCLPYIFFDLNDYRANIQNNVTSLYNYTFDDLQISWGCNTQVTRVNDDVIKVSKCVTDGVVVSYVKVNSTCTSMSFTPMNEEPATTSSLTQLIQYPLPDSWLEGVDGCVNPCG